MKIKEKDGFECYVLTSDQSPEVRSRTTIYHRFIGLIKQN